MTDTRTEVIMAPGDWGYTPGDWGYIAGMGAFCTWMLTLPILGLASNHLPVNLVNVWGLGLLTFINMVAWIRYLRPIFGYKGHGMKYD